MAITFVGTGSPPVGLNGGGSVTSIVATFPTGATVLADDIILIQVGVRLASTSIVAISGYTNDNKIASGTSHTEWIFWKRAVGGETAPTVTLPSGQVRTACIILRGAKTGTTPWRYSGMYGTSGLVAAGGTINFTNASTNVADVLYLAISAIEGANGGYFTFNSPLIERWDYGTSAGQTATRLSIAGSYEFRASTSDGSGRSAVVSAQYNYPLIALFVEPDAGGGTTFLSRLALLGVG